MVPTQGSTGTTEWISGQIRAARGGQREGQRGGPGGGPRHYIPLLRREDTKII